MTKMFKFLLCALAALTFLGCGDEKDYAALMEATSAWQNA